MLPAVFDSSKGYSVPGSLNKADSLADSNIVPTTLIDMVYDKVKLLATKVQLETLDNACITIGHNFSEALALQTRTTVSLSLNYFVPLSLQPLTEIYQGSYSKIVQFH